MDRRVREVVAAAAASDTVANEMAYRAGATTAAQWTTVCQICTTLHRNRHDVICSRCHNPLTENAAKRYKIQHEFAQRLSNDQVIVQVSDGKHGSRGMHRYLDEYQLQKVKDDTLHKRIRRLGYQNGADFYNERNWEPAPGETEAPPGWRDAMDEHHAHDRKIGRTLQDYYDMDDRRAYRKAHKQDLGMTSAAREAQFGGYLTVRAAPGAPPLRQQQGVGHIIAATADHNRAHGRERSRSAQRVCSRSSSWRHGG